MARYGDGVREGGLGSNHHVKESDHVLALCYGADERWGQAAVVEGPRSTVSIRSKVHRESKPKKND